MKKNYSIQNENEFNLFKNSDVYKKYYAEGTKYDRQTHLKTDIMYAEDSLKKLSEFICKLKQANDFLSEQFKFLFIKVDKEIKKLKLLIKKLKVDKMLDDLSELNLDETKEGTVRIKSLKQSDNKTYNISDKLSLLDLYIEQLNCYRYHFSLLSNVDKRIKRPKGEDEDINIENNYIENNYLELDYSVKNYIGDKLKNNKALFCRYIDEVKEGFGKQEKKYLYKRKDFIEDYFKANKIIKDLKNLIKSIANSKEINNKCLKDKKYTAETILNNVTKNMKEVKNQFINWRDQYVFDEHGRKLHEARNQILAYIFHFSNILENYKSLEKNQNNFIIKLEGLKEFEDCDRDYLKTYYCIDKKKELDIFKESDVYKKYYLKGTLYDKDNLKMDISWIESFLGQLCLYIKELESKKNKDGEDNFLSLSEQFDLLFRNIRLYKGDLEVFIKNLKLIKDSNGKYICKNDDSEVENNIYEFTIPDDTNSEEYYLEIAKNHYKYNNNLKVPSEIHLVKYYRENNINYKKTIIFNYNESYGEYELSPISKKMMVDKSPNNSSEINENSFKIFPKEKKETLNKKILNYDYKYKNNDSEVLEVSEVEDNIYELTIPNDTNSEEYYLEIAINQYKHINNNFKVPIEIHLVKYYIEKDINYKQTIIFKYDKDNKKYKRFAVEKTKSEILFKNSLTIGEISFIISQQKEFEKAKTEELPNNSSKIDENIKTKELPNSSSKINENIKTKELPNNSSKIDENIKTKELPNNSSKIDENIKTKELPNNSSKIDENIKTKELPNNSSKIDENIKTKELPNNSSKIDENSFKICSKEGKETIANKILNGEYEYVNDDSGVEDKIYEFTIPNDIKSEEYYLEIAKNYYKHNNNFKVPNEIHLVMYYIENNINYKQTIIFKYDKDNKKYKRFAVENIKTETLPNSTS